MPRNEDSRLILHALQKSTILNLTQEGHDCQTLLKAQILLANGTSRFLRQPLVKAGFVKLVLALHLAQAGSCLQVLQADKAPAASSCT